ncbi:MAG: ATP-binding protein [Fibrobacterota bacterium]
MLKRNLQIVLPQGKSAFLWGPRKTGKSTYLKENFKDSIYYDFLKTDLLFDFIKAPSLLREQLSAENERNAIKNPVILDEVQKVQGILDEVHWLIENSGMSFILCGSSARKLKHGNANMLGGRAWRYEMMPFTLNELGSPDLIKAVNSGLIPEHYSEENYIRSLKSYVQDYLKEEIISEGAVRNMRAFTDFLDAAAFSNGEVVNYSNIARDCGIDSKTVKDYFLILQDTLLGYMVEPYTKKGKRDSVLKSPKFYFFDTGIISALTGRRIMDMTGTDFGRAFEHLIFMELKAYSSYSGKDLDISYWRTRGGSEIDFVLGKGETVLEIKSGAKVSESKLRNIKYFQKQYAPLKNFVVCNEKVPRKSGEILLLPWKEFIDRLWAGEVV